MHVKGFPGGTVVKNLSAECRGHGFEPWSGNIPHAVEQLSLCATTTRATTTEPTCCNY